MHYYQPNNKLTMSKLNINFGWLLITSSTILLFFTYTNATTIAIGEVSQRDTNRPIYQIHLPAIGEYQPPGKSTPEELPVGVTSMKMVTARGQVMNCLLPAPQPIQRPTPSSRPLKENQFDDIDELMKPYDKRCFHRIEGWWTYEFCYGKHVIQKHVIPRDRNPQPGEQEDTFILGLYDRDIDVAHRKNISHNSNSDATFTQLFVNGTTCDMTNQPRRVLVKYVCRDEARQLFGSNKNQNSKENFISTIRETESCVYEIEFMNGAICEHSTYKEKMARAARSIQCSLEEDESPFEGLTSNTYRKANLNL